MGSEMCIRDSDAGGRAKLYADVAHPVNAACREMIQQRVVEEFKKELDLASQPGYTPRYEKDYFDEDPGPVAGSKDDKPVGEPDTEGFEQPVKEHLEGGGQLPQEDVSVQIRIDSAEKKPYKTHKPNDDLSQETNSQEEDFGKGVFE